MTTSPQNASTGRRPDQVDSPLALRHIPLTFDTTKPEESSLLLVEQYSQEWKNEEGAIEFVRFTEGITNTLMKAVKRRPGKTDFEVEKDAILIRAYGKDTEVLIDRERELRAHNLLANLGLAPPLLARFDNGLMYSFIAGDVCTPEDLRKPEVYRQVAKRLGQWHGILPISTIASTPILEKPSDEISKHLATTNGNSTRPEPNTWTVMQQWIDVLPTNTEEEKEQKQVLQAELELVSGKLGGAPGLDGKDYVFAHCDLLSGNVIIPAVDPAAEDKTTERPVNFIDYEYATPGHAAFDIANHFAEWCGFECDHSQVPTKSQRREFLEHYVASYRYHSISENDTVAVEIDFKKDIDQLYDQVEDFRGIPGLYWGIWALIQTRISQIDFDYASYAQHRFREYWAFKEESDGSREKEGREMYLRESRWHSE